MAQIVAAIQQDNGSVLFCNDTMVYPKNILNPSHFQMYKSKEEKEEDHRLVDILKKAGVMESMTHYFPFFS